MKKYLLILSFLLIVLQTACSSFIKDEQIAVVKEREAYLYEIKEDILNNKKVDIKKGTEVRIYFITSRSYIKVYALPARESYLDAHHVLVLYLFEDDFEDDDFDEAVFSTKFEKVLIKRRTLSEYEQKLDREGE